MPIRKAALLLLASLTVTAVTGCSGRFFNEPEATPSRSMDSERSSAGFVPQNDIQAREMPSNVPPPPRPSRTQMEPPPPPPKPSPKQTQLQAPPQPQTELAFHETTFDAKEKNRGINITRASKSINGAVVQPGETFSFNDTVGPTIKRRGYEKSIIFVDGKKSEGEGGGVCQVSSTLHNAALGAGMTIVERHDHSLPVNYVEAGKEAATSYGVIDYKFKNEKSHPVRINSSVKDGTIRVSITGV